MPFPEVERVIYKKNPLDKVICQLRFPPILRIDSELPSEFQEGIRKEFPNFNEKLEVVLEVIGKKPGSSPQKIFPGTKRSTYNKNYQFSSDDGIWILNLTRTFIALTCTRYERWEQFVVVFNNPLKAFISIYSPPFFSRIGLRYIDVLQRSKLGLDGVSWDELLKPHIIGLLSTEIAEHVQNCEHSYEISLDDKESRLRIMTAFVKIVDSNEKCFYIDSDLYTPEKTMVDGFMKKLDYLHLRSTRLLRWIISEKLHKAMDPEILT